MNEVKLSTKVKDGQTPRLTIKMNMKELGLPWQSSDIIRVMSYKNDGTVVLKRVGTKAKKTVAHTLTKTGGGSFEHDLGIFITHKPRRFEGQFKAATSVNAGVRFLDENKTMLEIYIPKEIYQ